ncbi:MAG: hypothetical protein ACOC3V_03860 [bacterium]
MIRSKDDKTKSAMQLCGTLTDDWLEDILDNLKYELKSKYNKLAKFSIVFTGKTRAPFSKGTRIIIERVNDDHLLANTIWNKIASNNHEVFAVKNNSIDEEYYSTKYFGVIIDRKLYPFSIKNAAIQIHLKERGILERQLNVSEKYK